MYRFALIFVLSLAVMALALGCGGNSGGEPAAAAVTAEPVDEVGPTVKAGDTGVVEVEEPTVEEPAGTVVPISPVAAVPEVAEEPGEDAVELVERLFSELGLGIGSRTGAEQLSDGKALTQSMPASSAKGGSPGGGFFPPESGGGANPNDQPYPLVYFEGHGVNPFVDADEDNLSTFALDGDTGSFEIARLYLGDGHLPDPDSVRVEEWVNFFEQGYGVQDEGLGLRLDGMMSPFGADGYRLLRVGVASERPTGPREPVSLIFVLDISGSMEGDERLGVAKLVIVGLAEKIGVADRVALVTYGNKARVDFPMSGGGEIDGLVGVVRELGPEGATNLSDGITRAYRLAASEIEDDRKVRIVVLSDGVGNIGASGPDSILDLVEEQTRMDVTVTTVGVGVTGNYNDVMLEALANRGNGTYHYLRGIEQAGEFVQGQAESVFREVARDARVQVEFNPEVVRKYRLIGYENRAVADSDFREDSLDFGELGFARDVTALYELRVEDDVADDARVAKVFLRWEDGDTGVVEEVNAEIDVAGVSVEVGDSSSYLVRTAAVAEFAEMLRSSFWAQCGDLGDVEALVEDVEIDDGGTDVLTKMLGQSEHFEPYCKT